jgi:tetratricopeptide (TPR) repeat protein
MNCELLPEDSIVLINRLLAIDPGHAPAYGVLGDACLMLDRPEEAIHHARLAVRLAPRAPCNFFRYAALAGATLQQNNIESTLHWARQTAALKPDYVVGHCLGATSLALMGDLIGARKAAVLAKQCLPGITRMSAKKLSPFYKGGVEPFVRGLALAGITAN